MVDVPYWSFNANITDDRAQRNSIAVYPRIFSGLGNVLTQILTLTMVGVLCHHSERTQDVSYGFFKWALIVSLIYVFTILVCVFTVKERKVTTEPKKRVSLAQTFKILVKNDQLVCVVVTFILTNLGMNCATGVAIYYFKYVWDNANLYSLFAVFMGASMGLGMILYPLVCKKFSRKSLFIYATASPTVGFTLMFVISFFFRNYSFAFYAFAAVAIIFCIGFGFLNVLLTVIIADCVDYDEWKRGKRNESVIFSMQTFLVKFATALSGLITGVGLKIGGYVGNTFVSDTVAMSTVPQSLVITLNIMMFALPPILFITATIYFTKKYKLFDNAYMEQIVADIVKRRENKELTESVDL
jgi:melibiose permease